MRVLQYAVFTGLVLGSAGAHAADPGFCDDYARAALRQIGAAQNACRYPPNFNAARWSGGYRTHYDWCLGVPYRAASEEREARREVLDRCRHL